MNCGNNVKVVAVASGKGGVGKTHIAINLAVALARAGRSTMLLDANLGLANVDLVLGLTANANLADVIRGDASLNEILIEGPAGITVVPGNLGETRLCDLTLQEHMGLVSAFSTLDTRPEYLVIDSAPGIGSAVLGFCAASDIVLIVLCEDPGSFADASALIRSLAYERGVKRFHIVCNRVRSLAHGRRLFLAFLSECGEQFDIALHHAASIPEDPAFVRAARTGKPLCECDPSGFVSDALAELADSIESCEVLGITSGRPIFFAGRTAEPTDVLPPVDIN